MNTTGISLDILLRTLSRDQSFDVLSSQANIVDYRAVVKSANVLQWPFARQMIAAGIVESTHVIVVRVGVAGLVAIQSAQNLDAIVFAFDVRSDAKEQV